MIIKRKRVNVELLIFPDRGHLNFGHDISISMFQFFFRLKILILEQKQQFVLFVGTPQFGYLLQKVFNRLPSDDFPVADKHLIGNPVGGKIYRTAFSHAAYMQRRVDRRSVISSVSETDTRKPNLLGNDVVVIRFPKRVFYAEITFTRVRPGKVPEKLRETGPRFPCNPHDFRIVIFNLGY